MGYLVHSVCYESQAMAQAAFCSNLSGVTDAGYTFCAGTYMDAGNNNIAYQLVSQRADGTFDSHNFNSSLSDCDSKLVSEAQASFPFNLSASDGFLLSAAIVGVWAGAFAWRALMRTLQSDNDGESS
jgi:hypothetical protein